MLKPDATLVSLHNVDQQDAEAGGVTWAVLDLAAEKAGWRRPVARCSNQKGRLSRRPEGGDSWRSVFVRSSPAATWYRRSSERSHRRARYRSAPPRGDIQQWSCRPCRRLYVPSRYYQVRADIR